jgi:hypothetical protein
MGDEPLVRASIPKSSWAEIVRSPAATKDKIIAVLGREFEGELGAQLTVTWVPFRIEARIADAVYQALGPAGTRAFYKAKTEKSFDIPWLRPLVTSSLRLFGATPNSLLKMLPRTWPTLSRNCGSYEFIDDGAARRGVSIINGFPTSAYRRHEAWLDSIFGGYEAFFAPFRLQGSVAVDEVNVVAGHARFTLTW